MKKRIFTLSIFLVASFLLVTSKVDALVCTYGTKSDNGSEWQKKFSFKIDDYNKIYVDLANSPELKNAGKELEAKDNTEYKLYRYGSYDIYLSMYKDKSMYDNLKSNCVSEMQKLNNDKKDYSNECGCPSTLRFHYEDIGYQTITHNWLIYNDELDKPKLEDTNFFTANKESIKEDLLIEERLKDKNLEEIEVSECPTYTAYIQRIQNTLEEKGCENNSEFDDAYTKLEEKCEALRATSTYTDESKTPKACQKACSHLYDEVEYNIETICGTEYQGGYCGSLGNKIVNKIFRILRIIRYGIPALVIILSILDYIKALASADEGEMKKVNKRFLVRVLVVALLFIIPFILDFVLKIFNIPGLSSTNPFCAK